MEGGGWRMGGGIQDDAIIFQIFQEAAIADRLLAKLVTSMICKSASSAITMPPRLSSSESL
jgi:hypothetical protein